MLPLSARVILIISIKICLLYHLLSYEILTVSNIQIYNCVNLCLSPGIFSMKMIVLKGCNLIISTITKLL